MTISFAAVQGKSYILNQLLGQSSGFTVGPTHRPCTKGLWMWSTPVERRAPDGSKYHLVCLLAMLPVICERCINQRHLEKECDEGGAWVQVLLDTEGIDAYDQVGCH